MKMEDSTIVQLYWDRDEKAIPETAKKYGNYCRFIASSILENKEDVEECMNDTYYHAWQAMPPGRPSVLATFLGKITRNLSFNMYKRSHAKKRGSGQLLSVLDELEECISGNSNPEEEYHRGELTEAINGFLESLPAVKRKLFVRRYWYTDSVSELAARYSMSENLVSVTLNRIRKNMKKYLLERGFEL